MILKCKDENHVGFAGSNLYKQNNIILSILSLGGAVWCTRRDRSRLNCYFSKVIFNNMPDGKKFHMIQIKVCNIGFREIILTELRAIGLNSCYVMGLP